MATVPYYPVNPNVYPADKFITDPSELKGGKLVGLGPYRVAFFKRDQAIALETLQGLAATHQGVAGALTVLGLGDPGDAGLVGESG